jgi:hypothetical protein
MNGSLLEATILSCAFLPPPRFTRHACVRRQRIAGSLGCSHETNLRHPTAKTYT